MVAVSIGEQNQLTGKISGVTKGRLMLGPGMCSSNSQKVYLYALIKHSFDIILIKQTIIFVVILVVF